MIDPGAGARAGTKWRKLLMWNPFLSLPCPPSAQWQDRKSPLLLAVAKELFESVQARIAGGADENASDKVSST